MYIHPITKCFLELGPKAPTDLEVLSKAIDTESLAIFSLIDCVLMDSIVVGARHAHKWADRAHDELTDRIGELARNEEEAQLVGLVETLLRDFGEHGPGAADVLYAAALADDCSEELLDRIRMLIDRTDSEEDRPEE